MLNSYVQLAAEHPLSTFMKHPMPLLGLSKLRMLCKTIIYHKDNENGSNILIVATIINIDFFPGFQSLGNVEHRLSINEGVVGIWFCRMVDLVPMLNQYLSNKNS